MSVAPCLAYLLVLPFHPVGLAALIGVGAAIMFYLDRREDIIITGITTTIVMVSAAISPQDAWLQPVWRLCDTVLGVAVGVTCKWIASFLYFRCIGKLPK